jgi:uncharacterized membrane protein YhaH (DUF805 family)
VFFTLALIIVAPVAIITEGILQDFGNVSNQSDVTIDDVSPLFLVIILTLIQIPLVTASFARAVQRMGAGEEVGVSDALRGGMAVFWSALLAILLAGVITALGFLALILPGIYLSVRLAFVGQAAAIERTGARNALRMSMRLTKGRFWSVLGILALVSFGGFIVATAVQAPFQAAGGTAQLAAAAIVQSAVNSVTALALTLVYFDLRVRAEPEPTAPVAVDAPSEGW